MPSLIRHIITLALLILLAGCTSFMSSPMMQMVRHAVPLDSVNERSQFDPRFQYLRVVVDGNVIFMASDTPDIDSAKTVGVWYSAGREVLRLQDGRLLAAVGLATEWRAVVQPELPGWAALVKSNAPLKWSRVRDVMPGYRFGVHDDLVIRSIPAPNDSQLKGIAAGSLKWFEERADVIQSDVAVRPADNLPVARYAVDVRAATAVVVYGEQCVSGTLCFSWQRWPVRAGQAK